MTVVFLAVASLIVVPTRPAWAALTVVSGADSQTMATSRFIYYGPQHKAVTAAAVYLNSAELCNPSAASVRGKIVFTSWSDVECDERVMYTKLDDAGAAGYVKLALFKIPGVSVLSHVSWSRTASHRRMVMVAVSKDAPDFHAWRASPNLVLSIDDERDDSFYDTFTSFQWTLCIRTLIPLFSFYASFVAFRDGSVLWNSAQIVDKKHQRELTIAAAAICAVEGPSMAILGLIVALGQYGPVLLVSSIHGFFFTMLTGVSLATTLALILLLRERSLTFPERPASESFWARNRIKITVLSVCFAAADVFVGAARVSGGHDGLGGHFYAAVGLVYVVCHFVLGIVFFAKAQALRNPLVVYLRLRASVGAEQRESDLRIGRFAFVLLMNGLFLFLMFAMEVSFVLLIQSGGTPDVSLYAVFVFYAIVSRVSISYWHVQAVSLNTKELGMLPASRVFMRYLLQLFQGPSPTAPGDVERSSSGSSNHGLWSISTVSPPPFQEPPL